MSRHDDVVDVPPCTNVGVELICLHAPCPSLPLRFGS